jgi:WD40-like Beta Propeller Repeat
MNRRHFIVCVVLLLAALAAQAISFAAPQAPTSKTGTLKPQTVIYALGASLFFQDLDGTPAREEKLALPKDAKIEHLSGARDGQTLAFSVGRNIYFYETASKTLTPVTPKDGGQYLYPSISPDGQSVSCRPYRANATLCILNRDGTVRDLGSTTEGATTSRFTLDGGNIYFANGPHLLRIAVEGGEAQPIVRGHYIQNFSINKEGLIIASVPTGSSTLKPALVDETGQVTTLTFEPNDFNLPTWSPGGTSVAFTLRARNDVEANAQGLYIWKNIKSQKETRKVSDAQSNAESGFVWR